MVKAKTQIKKLSSVLKSFEREVARASKNESRSILTQIITMLFLSHTNASTTKKILKAIQSYFVDWNEVRVSEAREIIALFEEAKVKTPWKLAYELQQVLDKIFEQYNIVNFEYGILDENLSREANEASEEEEEEALRAEVLAAASKASETNDDDDDDEGKTEYVASREEGLPRHEEYAGFLHPERLLKETSTLELKLIQKKNSDILLAVLWDIFDFPFARILQAISCSCGLTTLELSTEETLDVLRSALSGDQHEFARGALAYYEKNYQKVNTLIAKIPEKEAEQDSVDLEILSLSEQASEQVFEPLMPRSDNIGRPSKQAKVLLPASSSKSRKPKKTVAKAAQKKKKISKKSTKKKAVKKK